MHLRLKPRGLEQIGGKPDSGRKLVASAQSAKKDAWSRAGAGKDGIARGAQPLEVLPQAMRCNWAYGQVRRRRYVFRPDCRPWAAQVNELRHARNCDLAPGDCGALLRPA